MNFPIYENDAYLMREVKATDAKDIFEYYQDRDFMKYTAVPPHNQIAETEALIQRLCSYFPNDKGIAWVIEDKELNKVIGNITMCYTGVAKTKAAVGYNVSIPYQNRGIATWALSNCLNFGLNELKLGQIDAKCKSVNTASERVMQKCGMIYIGTQKSPFLVDGIYYDIKTYSITPQDS